MNPGSVAHNFVNDDIKIGNSCSEEFRAVRILPKQLYRPWMRRAETPLTIIALCALLISYFSDGLALTVPIPINFIGRVLDVAAGLAIAIKILIQPHCSVRALIMEGVLIALGLASAICSKEFTALSVSLIVCGGQGLDLQKVAKYLFISITCAMAIMLVLFLSGGAQDVINSGRHSLGYSHPNIAARDYFLAVIFFFVWKSESWKPFEMLAMLLVGIVVLYLTSSRTSGLLIMGAFVAALLYRYSDKRMLVTYIFLVLALLSIISCVVLMFLYDGSKPLFIWVNELLSSRPYLTNALLLQNGLSLFGQEIVLSPGMILDPAYAHWLLCYGIVPTGALLSGITLGVIKQLATRCPPFSLLALALMLIAGITESFPLSSCNFLLVYASLPIFGVQCEVKGEE